MNFLFFDAADRPLFSRDDVEEATHTHEEMSLYLLFPYNPGKVIQRGMRVGYLDTLGDFQVFEIRKAKMYEPDHYQEITAEHIVISELTDEFCEAREWTNITAQAALTDLLTGTLWSVGAVTASGVSSGNVGTGNVWQNIRTIESNWNVYIIPRVTVSASGITGRYLDIVPAGGTWRGLRFSLEKNMDETGVTWDDTRLKTALYGFGKAVEAEGEEENQPLTFADVVWTETEDHPAKPAGQTYLEDPNATAVYGRNGRARFGYYQNGDISDPEILLQKTWETLKTVSVPDVSIDGTVKNLRALGNAAEVPIRLHDTALIEISPTGVILQKEVIRYTEDLLNSLNDRVNIGDYIPNIIYINRETAEQSGGGGGSGGQTNLEYKITEFDTEIAANLYQISLRAYQRDMDNVDEILRQAGISIDAQGVIVYADDNPNMLQSKFNVQAGAIEQVVQKKSAVYPQFTDPAQETGAGIQDGDVWVKTNSTRTWAEMGEASWVDSTEFEWQDYYGAETYIRKNGKWELIENQQQDYINGTQIRQNENEIALVAGNLEGYHAQFSVAADEIRGEVANTQGQLSVVSQKADEVSIEVANARGSESTLGARLAVTDQAITSKVSAGDIASTINQTAQSVLIQAQKIDLQGYVTASQLQAEIGSFYNASTGTLSASWITVQGGQIGNLTVSGSFNLGVSRHVTWQTTTIGGVTLHYLGSAPT